MHGPSTVTPPSSAAPCSVESTSTRTSMPLSMICREKRFGFCCTSATSSDMLPEVSMPKTMSAGCSMFSAI